MSNGKESAVNATKQTVLGRVYECKDSPLTGSYSAADWRDASTIWTFEAEMASTGFSIEADQKTTWVPTDSNRLVTR
jgi:hypothetical protein